MINTQKDKDTNFKTCADFQLKPFTSNRQEKILQTLLH